MASRTRGGDKPKSKKKNGVTPFQEDSPAGERAGLGHNSDARLKALDDGLDEFCKLQAEEDALMEKYIHPVRDKKNKVKSRLKSDHEMPTAAFNARAALRLIELQDDDEIVLAVNEMFKATPVGKNLDLIALAERVATKKAEEAAKKSKVQNVEHTI